MKIIPKYVGGDTFQLNLPTDWINYINWNNYDWFARDKKGAPRTIYDYPATDLLKKRGVYGYDRGLNFKYEDLDWYNSFNLNTLYDNNKQLLENGRNWFDMYLEHSKGTPWYPVIEKFVKSGYTDWDSSNVTGGNKYSTGVDFMIDKTTDKNPGLAHMTNTGDTYYDDKGNIYKDIPEGYEAIPSYVYRDEDNIPTPYEEQINAIRNQNPKLKYINFIPLLKKVNVPDIDGNIPPASPTSIKDQAIAGVIDNFKPEKGTLEYALANSELPTEQQKIIQERWKNPGAIPGDNPGIKGVFGKFGKWVGRLFKGNEDGEHKDAVFNSESPAWTLGLRILMDNAFNTRNTKNLIDKMDVPLVNYTPVYKQVHGDYVALLLAKREAARLRTSQPITANQQIQSATDLEGIQKGNLIIERGNAQDALMYWNTAEKAFLQAKENARGQDAVANQNTQKLSEFNNKIAELLFNTGKLNMLNWDTFLTDMEKRAWQEYDRKRDRKITTQEGLEDLYDAQFGLSKILEELQLLEDSRTALISSGKTSSDPELRATIQNINRLNNIIIARKYYNKLHRLNMYNPDEWRKLYTSSDYNFDNEDWDIKLIDALRKNMPATSSTTATARYGGILYPRFQTGGTFGVVAASSAGPANPYLSADSSTSSKKKDTSSTSGSSSSDDDKTRDKLLTNIAETIKGVDGLNSDVDILYKELINFFDVLRYSSKYNISDDPMLFYSMYIRALNRVNQVKQSAKQFDAAYKELEKRNAITSPAIDSNGYVFVGIDGTNQVDRVTPKEYLENPSKYKLLKNNQLLDLRRNNSNFAFNDKYITEIAYNGTNILDIYKYVKDIISKVGSDKETKDLLVKQYGNNAVLGLLKLQKLVLSGEVDSEAAQIIAGLTGALTEYNISTENSIRQAELALKTVIGMLPANMLSFLLLHSGGAENVEKLLASLIFQGLDVTTDFKINNITVLDENGMPKSGSTKGSGSGSDGAEKGEPPTTTATKWAQGYGQKSTFSIVGGSNIAWTVSGNTLGITDSTDKSLGQTTLAELKSGWGSALDIQHAYMGNNRLSALAQSQIVLEDGDITYVALPIDLSVSYPKPAFSRLKNLSKADAELREKGIDITKRENLTSEEKAKVNEVYKKYELDPFFDKNGAVNKLKFAYFGLIKGITSESAFEGKELVKDFLIEANDLERKLYEEILKSNPKTKEFSLSNGLFGTGLWADEVYRGTIFIPVRTNIFNTQSGYGSTYSGTGQVDIRTDTRQQRFEAELAQGGVHPDRVKQTNFLSLQ